MDLVEILSKFVSFDSLKPIFSVIPSIYPNETDVQLHYLYILVSLRTVQLNHGCVLIAKYLFQGQNSGIILALWWMHLLHQGIEKNLHQSTGIYLHRKNGNGVKKKLASTSD